MGQIFCFNIEGDPYAQIIVAAARSNGQYSLTAFKQILRDGEYHTIDRCSESSTDQELIEAAQASVAAQLGHESAL